MAATTKQTNIQTASKRTNPQTAKKPTNLRYYPGPSKGPPKTPRKPPKTSKLQWGSPTDAPRLSRQAPGTRPPPALAGLVGWGDPPDPTVQPGRAGQLARAAQAVRPGRPGQPRTGPAWPIWRKLGAPVPYECPALMSALIPALIYPCKTNEKQENINVHPKPPPPNLATMAAPKETLRKTLTRTLLARAISADINADINAGVCRANSENSAGKLTRCTGTRKSAVRKWHELLRRPKLARTFNAHAWHALIFQISAGN